MSAVTVRMLGHAWRALELERAQGTGWTAFTHYHDLLGQGAATGAPGAPAADVAPVSSLETILELRARIRVLERELEAYRTRRTLGGPPPACQMPGAWQGVTMAPPTIVAGAPPLHTELGSDRGRRA